MPVTFRNSKIVYYGPHPCNNCDALIVKAGDEWGGTSFTNPSGPIYPNTEWHPHICDPFEVLKLDATRAKVEVRDSYGAAALFKTRDGHFLVATVGNDVAISPCSTFYDTPEAAWVGAQTRMKKDLPVWALPQYCHPAWKDASGK